jgi:putative chitinase
MMRFDRKRYFDAVRQNPFGGSLDQCQVDGQNIILAVWEYQALTDRRWLAYMLATVHKECATRFWPISEYGSQSYLEGKEYYPYIGRGWVMLTWKDNYQEAADKLGLTGERDLVEHPELALDSLIATRILFRGMIQGWFTGRKLEDYFNDHRDDPVNARQIINGNDCDDEIAGYHRSFLAALDDALIEEPEAAEPTIDIALVTTGRVTISVTLNGEPIMVAGV